jgi:hypothetical protein
MAVALVFDQIPDCMYGFPIAAIAAEAHSGRRERL